ncbi:unnamed protein product [Closterium sp. Yama58-4]|nr:unnamed protein product [Closterium sp. Yama58-4]
MSASNGVSVRRHMWEESASVEREAVSEDREGIINGGGDMASESSGGDLDCDFDVGSEEEVEREVGEEGGNGGGESDINGEDTIGQCTNGHDTDDQGVGDDHLNGAAIGGASRKRGRSPSEPGFAEGGEYKSLRVPGFARHERDSRAGDKGREEEAAEEDEEEDDEEEEDGEDDGFSEDLEEDNGNRLSDGNFTSVDASDDAFFCGAIEEGDDEDGGFLEVAGARDAEGRIAADTCSGVEADVAVEGRADVERAGEAAAHAPKADVAAAESTTKGLLPDEVILEIIARVSDARARNCCALVLRRWRMSERLTLTSLSVLRSLVDLLELPRCFPNVRRLDFSLCPPCGKPLLLAGPALEVVTSLRAAFPRVTSLRVHVRDRNDVQCVAVTWL